MVFTVVCRCFVYFGQMVLFWPTVRRNCSSDREKLWKFEAEGQEFAKFLRSLKQFFQTVKGGKKFLVIVCILLGVYNFMSWLFFDCMTCLNFWACPANQSSSKIYFANIPYTLLNNYTISPVTYLLVYLINVMFGIYNLIAECSSRDRSMFWPARSKIGSRPHCLSAHF